MSESSDFLRSEEQIEKAEIVDSRRKTQDGSQKDGTAFSFKQNKVATLELRKSFNTALVSRVQSQPSIGNSSLNNSPDIKDNCGPFDHRFYDEEIMEIDEN